MDNRRRTSNLFQQLTAIRQELWGTLAKVDSVLANLDEDHGNGGSQAPTVNRGSNGGGGGGPRSLPIPVAQTYPPKHDFRQDPEGLRQAVTELQDRVMHLDEVAEDLNPTDLFHEISLRAAKARLFQTQATEGSKEWETLVQIVKTLTRIVSDLRPGYVYGLASGHNANWGEKIEEALRSHPPIDLPA